MLEIATYHEAEVGSEYAEQLIRSSGRWSAVRLRVRDDGRRVAEDGVRIGLRRALQSDVESDTLTSRHGAHDLSVTVRSAQGTDRTSQRADQDSTGQTEIRSLKETKARNGVSNMSANCCTAAGNVVTMTDL
jgi:hypothetical protein